MTVDPHPASVILQQLGGRRFVAMTGAKDFTSGNDPYPHLLFRLPTRTTKGKATHFQISLLPSDTYSLKLLKVRLLKDSIERLELDQREPVYADKLRQQFTEMTGLHTSL